MENINLPSEEQVLELARSIIKSQKETLNEEQLAKFYHACYKAIIENPGVNDSGILLAAKIYFNIILLNPGVQL